jgi:hypothetical protein
MLSYLFLDSFEISTFKALNLSSVNANSFLSISFLILIIFYFSYIPGIPVQIFQIFFVQALLYNDF